METTKLYRIAVSPLRLHHKPENGDPIWEELTTSHVSMNLPVIEIANAIYLGQQTTNWHAPLGKSARRCADNWHSAQIIYVDFDAETPQTTVDYVCALPFVRRYGMLVHTTMSHKDPTPDNPLGKPRCRALFGLSEPVTDPQEYKRLATALTACCEGADQSGTALSRPFYGSPNCRIEIIDKVLDLRYLRYVTGEIEEKRERLKAQMEAHKNGANGAGIRVLPAAYTNGAQNGQPYGGKYGASEPSDQQVENNLSAILEKVRSSHNGNRNNMLNWAAYEVAKDWIATGRVTVPNAQQNLLSAAIACGLDKREATQTIHSAFRGAGVVGGRAGR